MNAKQAREFDRQRAKAAALKEARQNGAEWRRNGGLLGPQAPVPSRANLRAAWYAGWTEEHDRITKGQS